MDAFLSSTAAVALAEIGDKTQLLTLFLAARYRKPMPIIMGILVATILNHLVSGWIGAWVGQSFNANIMAWVIGISFIAVGFWLLVPDKDEEVSEKWLTGSAFVATAVLFFLAEIGDKTQLATVFLAAKYQDVFWVVVGSTLGLMIANVPMVFLGDWLLKKLPLNIIRVAACVLFVVLGLVTLYQPLMALFS
ncbi:MULTISPECIES: TMEM165/GDT1 family protein [Vitreoscilla]|uniref:GDT1 family protein n=1 Tax=Vitreoscilla stercoraria TaxID=61 RepID=A0ABY4EAL8_VITST|nr:MULTISPECIES: TMEM165/GDT1 family protein [Vitreoscilla]AUZ06204.1 hypothetical protein ADP71_30040 [Vitreoscilla sp. C1]UOO92435.1 TMEM165/GDT1 family protein [Vitreoscilla stercoraria]